MRILYCPSMPVLIFGALLLGLVPFVPEPHLLEKLRMLWHGTLVRPMDMFDLFWHGWPLLWITLRVLTHAPEGHSCAAK